MAECVAAEPTETIAFDRPGLRALLAASPEMGELVLGLPPGPPGVARGRGARRDAPHRRARLAPGLRGPRPARAQPCPAPRPRRRPRPVRGKILDWLDITREETPILVRYDRVLRNPSAAQVARELGLGRRSTGSASTWWCSAPARRGWRPPSTAPRRVDHRRRRRRHRRPGRHLLPHRELPRLPHRDLRRRAHAGGDAPGAPLRRGPLELPPRGGADRRPRGADPDRPGRRPARPGADGGHGDRRPLARARRPRRGALPGGRASTTPPCRPTPSAIATRTSLWSAAATRPGRRRRTSPATPAASASRCAAGVVHHHVALPGRAHRAIAPHRAADRDRGGGPARPGRAGRGHPPGRRRRAAGPGARRVRDDRRRAVHRGRGRRAGVDAAGYLLCGPGAAKCDGRLRWPLSDRAPHLLETVRPGVFAAGDVRAGRPQLRGRRRRRRAPWPPAS